MRSQASVFGVRDHMINSNTFNAFYQQRRGMYSYTLDFIIVVAVVFVGVAAAIVSIIHTPLTHSDHSEQNKNDHKF